MGKLKTKRGVAKRFKLSKTGKVKYHAGGKSHLATCKKQAHMRRLRKMETLAGRKERRNIKRLLPYG